MFHNTPPFRRDTICQFHSNISGLKHLAAHDFEDILLCSMAVFDGHLPSLHDEIVLSLLFIAHWFHSLVKLKMHTRVTLMALTTITTMFGHQMCRFKSQTCDIIPTFELDHEVSAHTQRLARQNLASCEGNTNDEATTKDTQGDKSRY
ncbi:hypothetical protein JB92DRAFT_2704462 [Gautieria morchelliformis]|nr:hypothetical protein JB92DRAFT_2704462 [Gautieria morchelliformis]